MNIIRINTSNVFSQNNRLCGLLFREMRRVYLLLLST